MIAIVCVDEKGGMFFNRRRQSQDRVLRSDLLGEVHGRPLWMNQYSAKQFKTLPDNVHVAVDFLERASDGDFCFVEDQDLTPWLSLLEGLILYRWNRVYPADLFFTLPLQQWSLARQEDFAGSSHPNITKEVYTL